MNYVASHLMKQLKLYDYYEFLTCNIAIIAALLYVITHVKKDIAQPYLICKKRKGYGCTEAKVNVHHLKN